MLHVLIAMHNQTHAMHDQTHEMLRKITGSFDFLKSTAAKDVWFVQGSEIDIVSRSPISSGSFSQVFKAKYRGKDLAKKEFKESLLKVNGQSRPCFAHNYGCIRGCFNVILV
jgi:hypothetical protein